MEGTVGMTFGDRVLVCGGGGGGLDSYVGYGENYSCWAYDPAGDKWVEDLNSPSKDEFRGCIREKCSAALSLKYGWVIVREKHSWYTAVHTHDGRNYTELPSMRPTRCHFDYDYSCNFGGLTDLCLVSLDDEAGVGDLFVMGKEWPPPGQQRVFILKDGAWEEKERYWIGDYATEGFICGPVRSQVGGPVEKIVVAGGAGAVVQIYDVRKDSWENADDLPFGDIHHSTAIPYEDTFLMIGGRGEYDTYSYKEERDDGKKWLSYSYSDKVWKYKKNGEWEEMRHLQLSEGKASVTAIVVRSDIFPRCYRAHFEVKNSSDTVWPAETCSAGT